MVVKLLRGSRLLNKVLIRNFSAEVATKVNERRVFARRAETNDPLAHTENDLAKFYTVPKAEQVKLFGLYEFPPQFQLNLKTFNETAFMIREPALEIINSLKTLNPKTPVQKFVLYGLWGHGKTISLSHVVHYAYKSEFIVVHVPAPMIWLKWSREVTKSETKPDLYNLPVESAQFLKNFKNQNENLLKKLDDADPQRKRTCLVRGLSKLKTSDQITWSPREVTEKDSPLLDLIDHGINRLKYAADVVDILFDELKKYSSEQKCKTLLAVDGFNTFYNEKTDLKKEDRRTILKPKGVSLVQSVLKLAQSDWTNGAVVLTVDKSASLPNRRETVFPLHLLTKEGFEHLDPFIPVHVPPLTTKESSSLLDFYEEKKWLLKPEGRDEIEFLCARSPFTLAELCAPH